MVAVGMAFPDAENAEAQGISVLAGYTYTRMICQEWGQQPRWYNVRDPIAGSDWSNTGGWAIVLVRGSGTYTVLKAYGNITYTFGFIGFDRDLVVRNAQGGLSAYVALNASGQRLSFAFVDQNGDGQITPAGDCVDTDNNGAPDSYAIRNYREVTVVSGGRYIRWANMRWCR